MNQVINEAKKTGFAIRGCVIASRKHLCSNERVLKLKSLNKINKECKNLITKNRCPYSSNFTRDQIIGFNQLQDIEDLKKNLSYHKKCGFFKSRKIMKSANLLVMSYNYMSDPVLRAKISEYFKGSLIIIDEGHNLGEVFERSASFEWKMDLFNFCFKDLRHVRTAIDKHIQMFGNSLPFQEGNTNQDGRLYPTYFILWLIYFLEIWEYHIQARPLIA